LLFGVPRFRAMGPSLLQPKPLTEWEWLPSHIEECDEVDDCAALPAAILPPWATPRILAQRGRFTVHESDRVPIDTCFARSTDVLRRNHIGCIELARPAQIADELKRLGFALDRLFREPEKLAEHLRALGA
jgi:hypothetical protein